MNLYTILEKLDSLNQLNEGPIDWGKKFFNKDEENKKKDSDNGLSDLEQQAAQVRAGGGRKMAEPKSIDDCQPGDVECLRRFVDRYDDDTQPDSGLSSASGESPRLVTSTPEQERSFKKTELAIKNSLIAHIQTNAQKWVRQYPQSAHGAIIKEIEKLSYSWVETLEEWYNEKEDRVYVERRMAKDGIVYYAPTEKLVEHIFNNLQMELPSAAVFWNMDESKELDDNSLNEGAATVFSDAAGHHLKNADGQVVQSFPKTPEGLRAARNALYADYNALSIETPKESVMKEYEEKFNAALNESLTITTTAGTDQPDNVSVNATDEDAHTLVAILKAAGLPYKEREAQLVAATPCGEQVEEEYSNEPEEKTMSVDYMVNQLSGGLGKQQKMYRKEYPGDNAMAVNEENLMRGLWDLYKKV
jgi:hypothetical protein